MVPLSALLAVVLAFPGLLQAAPIPERALVEQVMRRQVNTMPAEAASMSLDGTITAFSNTAAIARRASACFLPGSVALPAEVEAGIPALQTAVTCDATAKVFDTIPDVSSSGVSFSSIDFRKSTLSPLGFSLATFTSTDPAVIQNQLNTYLAVEAGARSLGGAQANAFLAQVKLPKFVMQFQMARVNEAAAVAVGAAGTVEHQLQKVQKNAGKASKADLDALLALSKQPVKRSNGGVQARALTLLDYADFQISSDTAGTALAKAEKVFAIPGGDAAAVSQADLKVLASMRSAAEAAETDFNTAIDAAGGTKTAAGAALQVGKIQNKVLKLFGLVQINTIKLAQGGDAKVQAAFDDASKKLANNVKADTASAGQATTAIAGKASNNAAAVTTNDNAAEAATNDVVAEAAVSNNAATQAAGLPLVKYADFQISSDTAGTALAKAERVFAVPGGDAATVSQADLKVLASMRSAAEAAETDFNTAIDAAGGTKTAEGAALQVGKIQNKVLKLFGLVQINTIKLAQGGDAKVQAAFDDASKKLANNVKLDVAAVGQTTTGLPTSQAATEFA